MNEEQKKRLFVAVAIPDSVKRSLEEVQSELKRYARDAKWVRADGIHLTLKFLGYVEENRIAAIAQSLAGVAVGCAPVDVEVRGCGVFPNTRRPNVLWAGVGSASLGRLQERVESAMADLGFEKEKRPFSPHLTLARFRDPQGLTPLILELEKRKTQPLGEFRGSHFKLYESVLHRQGAEYRVLREFALEGTQWI